MTIAQSATNTFKLGLPKGDFDFDVDTFKIALYTGAASIGPETTTYTTDGEVVASGYTAGGAVLTVTQVPTIGNQTGVATVYLSFANVTWASSLTARGALIYKSGVGNPSVCVLDFGADKTSTTTFTVQFPAATNTAAIIRIS
jgi:O-acetylhomoserine/O-acetylserine sulfhydrylase-like pyridoxal-dependent enzyme